MPGGRQRVVLSAGGEDQQAGTIAKAKYLATIRLQFPDRGQPQRNRSPDRKLWVESCNERRDRRMQQPLPENRCPAAIQRNVDGGQKWRVCCPIDHDRASLALPRTTASSNPASGDQQFGSGLRTDSPTWSGRSASWE